MTLCLRHCRGVFTLAREDVMKRRMLKEEWWIDVWVDGDNLSDTTRCRAAILKMVARLQHLSESLSGLVTRLPQRTIIMFAAFLTAKKQCSSSSWWLTYTSWFDRAPASHPGRQELSGVLHQFVQQSPYTVVLLSGASYGFVAHGADAAHLKPLYQTP